MVCACSSLPGRRIERDAMGDFFDRKWGRSAWRATTTSSTCGALRRRLHCRVDTSPAWRGRARLGAEPARPHG